MSERTNTAERRDSDSGRFPVGGIKESISPTSGVARKVEVGRPGPALVIDPVIDWEKRLTEGPPDPLPATSPIHVIILVLLRITIALFARLRVKGSRALSQGPKLFVASRPRALDGVFIACSLPLWSSREVYFLVGEEHTRSPVMRFLAERARVIIAHEEGGSGNSQRAVAAALRTGRSVVVFPHSLPSTRGRPGGAEEGYAAIARHVGVPLIPIALQQSGGMPAAGVKLPKLGKRMDVTFLSAIAPGENPAETSEAVRQAILHKIGD